MTPPAGPGRLRAARTAASTIVVGLLVAATACARSSGPGAPSPPSVSPSRQPAPSASARGSCSAADLSPDLPKQDLPQPVASMRSRIAKAATECDYDGLERLALATKEGFSFSFGGQQGRPGEFWRKLEAEGSAPLAFLVKVLSVPYATRTLPAASPSPGSSPAAATTLFTWPAAATKDVPSDKDWSEVERIYPKEQVARMKQDTARFGIGYLGWRAGITAPGEWIYFIEGD